MKLTPAQMYQLLMTTWWVILMFFGVVSGSYFIHKARAMVTVKYRRIAYFCGLCQYMLVPFGLFNLIYFVY